MQSQAAPAPRLFVGTPMYDGRCTARFTFALCQLSALAAGRRLPLELFFASGEALVARARNAIAAQFLRSDATHLMLIDADIGFAAADVLALLDLQASNGGANPYDIVSAPYPAKFIRWDNVSRAVRQGLAEADPAALAGYASDVLLYPAQDGPFAPDAPLEVRQAGTGFMLIRRATLEAFRARYPARRYAASGTGIESGCGPQIAQFFEGAIDGQEAGLEEDLRDFLAARPDAGADAIRAFLAERQGGLRDYVSEDFAFCRLVRRMGLRIWACPWMELTHSGGFDHAGRLARLAQLAPGQAAPGVI